MLCNIEGELANSLLKFMVWRRGGGGAQKTKLRFVIYEWPLSDILRVNYFELHFLKALLLLYIN